MQLRPHQEKGYNQAIESIRRGLKRPIIAAATAYGKTVLSAYMMKRCQEKGKKGFFICDRIKLVDQTIDKFTAMGVDFGVRQSNHELQNPTKPIQICSVQTLAAMVNIHGKSLPEFDFAIIDEAHTQYSIVEKIISTYDNIPVIGLTATPYSKGLGKLFNNLIVPITPRELLGQGYLCPVRYYGGAHVDMSKIRSVDANTYSTGDLEISTELDKERLTGDIIKNWMKWGENSQTIAFSPSQNHSKFLVERFNANGVSAEHIDCYTPDGERRDLYEAHDKGEFKILSCSRLLNTGYDAPTVRCLIDCFPTKSITTYVQRVGRIMRTAEGKAHAIYLDHAGNFDRFGHAEDIVPESLHNGEKVHRETDLVTEKKTPKTKDCPQCYQKMTGIRCFGCGYVVPMQEQMKDDGSMLVELTGKPANKKTSMREKELFLAEMRLYGAQKGYKYHWADMQYKDKFGVYPNKIQQIAVNEISETTKGWIQHQNIKRARARR